MSYDKQSWGEGPWTSEPDRLEFRAHDLPCLLKRNMRSGNWCAYVGVPPGHPWHGKGYNDIDADAHGGLTYAEACDGDPENGVCHVPMPGEPEHAWWVGMDFHHGGDLAPGFEARMGSFLGEPSHYWTLDEARAETERLASQAAALEAKA